MFNLRNPPASALLAIAFILISLLGCKTKMVIGRVDKTLYPINSSQPIDSNLLAYYQPYKINLDSQMQKVIAVSEVAIVKSKPEGPLNNLVADAMFYAGKSKNIDFDVAYTNYGGLRIALPKGDIQLYRVFELMPFENLLTTVKFNGTDMQLFLDYIAEGGGDPVSGARFKIKGKKATDVLINGEPLDPDKSYVVLTSDYMANGGDGGEIFFKASDRKTYEVKLRDALLSYLQQQTKEGKTLNPVNDGRISVE